MKRYTIILSFFLCCFVQLMAASTVLENADNAFLQKKYNDAIRGYESALQEGTNVDLYYNLGNAYFRTNDLGRAILNYERALMLQPGDEDVQHNLEIAKAKVANQFNVPSEMFFITWVRELVLGRTCNTWGIYALVVLALTFVAFGVYRYADQLRMRQLSFAGVLMGGILFVLCNVAAAWSWSHYSNDPRAVVVTPVALLTDSKKDAQLVMDLQPGVVVKVIEETLRGWTQVELPNTKRGWLASDAVIGILPQPAVPEASSEQEEADPALQEDSIAEQ